MNPKDLSPPPPPPPPPPNKDGRESTTIPTAVANQDNAGTAHAAVPPAVASSYHRWSPTNMDLPELEKLISDKKEFNTAKYLNYALQNLSTLSSQENSNSDHDIPNEKMTQSKAEDDVSQRVMAELALSLQMQTQSCHDEIGRIGAELRAIVPRCSADLSRLKVGMENLKDDAKALLEAHIARRKSQAVVYQGGDHHDDSLSSSWRNYEQEESKDHEFGEDHHRLCERRRRGESPLPDDDDDYDNDGRKEITTSRSIPSERDLDTNGDDNIHAADDDDEDDHEEDDNRRSSFAFTPTTALETLSTLHALKHNLNSAKQVLVAASTYNQTLAKIPSLLNPSTIHQCVQAWMDLEHGAKALSGMPGKVQRQEEIQEIRQEILTLLKPVLLHALNKVDSRLGPLQTCVSLYQSLGEMPSLMDEYVKVRPSSVHKLWFNYRKLSVDKSSLGLDHVVGDVTRDNVDSIGHLEGIDRASEEEEKENDGLSVVHEAGDPSVNFITWLPTWYDAVLELLSEERRRAHAVFGAELAPEVMVKVLNQCFRPISSSFEKRLAALCGADAELMRSGGGQLFDGICRAYASTLQFLSVAYEQLVDFDNHASSSMTVTTEGGAYDGSSGNKTPIQLHLTTLDTFAAIVSPFAAHQRNFATLESNYSGVSTRGLSTDLHKAVSGRLINSSDMQKSVEQLASLATSMFPLVQGSLARYELMKCGFGISDGLDTIDKILSANLGELSIAFHTLLANSLSTQRSCDPSYSNGFDDQQIHCALDVLKIAGDMRTKLHTFHENVRDRIRLLASRMEAAVEQKFELSEAVNQSHYNSTLVPDSLSIAEIEILLAIRIHEDGVNHDNSKKSSSITALRMRSNVVDESENSLFPKSLDSLKRLIKTSQQFVFDICAAVPLHFLNDMHSLPMWSKEDNMLSNITSTSYGTLPQSYITQVGEHLLALVQALEPFASDRNALNVAMSVMDGLEHVNLKYWRNFANALSHGHNDDDFINSLRRGENMKNSLLISTENDIEDEEDFLDENELEAQQFCNQWLDVICSSVTGVLLENTMRIEYLTPKGCEHFCTDLNYIVNVLTALGVSGHPHPLLIHVLELLKLSVQELEYRIINAPEDAYSLRNMETRLLQIRRQ